VWLLADHMLGHVVLGHVDHPAVGGDADGCQLVVGPGPGALPARRRRWLAHDPNYLPQGAPPVVRTSARSTRVTADSGVLEPLREDTEPFPTWPTGQPALGV